MGEIEAGQELDALVAESVMGWEIQRSRATGCVYAHVLPRSERHIRYKLFVPKDAANRVGDNDGWFCPSIDIAAAWLVVEKLIADGWELFITNEPEGWSIEAGRDVSTELGGHCITGEVVAPTFPLAVCRVALYVTERVAALLTASSAQR